MLGTANWYCARCSRFIDNTLTRCDACHRPRGSARYFEPSAEASSLYWLRVQSPRARVGASSAPAPSPARHRR